MPQGGLRRPARPPQRPHAVPCRRKRSSQRTQFTANAKAQGEAATADGSSMPQHAQQEEESQRQSAHRKLQSSNNCPTRSATTSLLIRYSEVGTDRPNRQRLAKRSNIAQQLNSGSRKTRRSSITRQGRNNWQRQRNTQITQDGRNQGSAKSRRILSQTAVFHALPHPVP